MLDAAERLNKVRPEVVAVGVLDVSDFEESNFKELIVEHWTRAKSKWRKGRGGSSTCIYRCLFQEV